MLRQGCLSYLTRSLRRASYPCLSLHTAAAPALRGVIFDLDGCLTAPNAIDFPRMRSRIKMTNQTLSVLHWIDVTHPPGSAAHAEAVAIVEEEERFALKRMELNKGFGTLVETLKRLQVRTAIVTRNSADALDAFNGVMERHGYGGSGMFEVQLARDAYSEALGRVVANKPSCEPAHEVLRKWGEGDEVVEAEPAEKPEKEQFVFVGDNLDDCLCGRSAGMASILVTNGEVRHAVSGFEDEKFICDFATGHLEEVASILSERG